MRLPWGVYNIRKFEALENTRLKANGAVEFRVQETLEIGKDSTLKPNSGSGITAADILFYVAGTGVAAEIGTVNDGAGNADIRANIYAPNGTVRINKDGDLTGAVLGQSVVADEIVTLTLDISDALQNIAPVADAQSVSTNEDTAVGITLTGSDANGDPITFDVASNPSNGTLSGTAPNLTYTPNADFNGADSFTFTANDGTVSSAAATVSITVNPVNDAPVADDQNVSVNEDDSLAITLTGSDVEGSALTFAVGTGPSNGTLSGTAPNLTYAPNADFNGSDSFTFTANDGSLDSAEATVSITVDAVNDAPTANAASAATDEDVAVDIALSGNDIDGDALTFAVADAPSAGTVVINGSTATYTPLPNVNGVTDSFTVTANDGQATSAPATVDITAIAAVNDDPVAQESTAVAEFIVEDPPVPNPSVSITLEASDIDGDALMFTITGTPTGGMLNIDDIDNGIVSYTPTSPTDRSTVFTDMFTFQVDDGNGGTDTAVVTINAVNSTPTAFAATLATTPAIAGDFSADSVGVDCSATPNDPACIPFVSVNTPVNAPIVITLQTLTTRADGVVVPGVSAIGAGTLSPGGCPTEICANPTNGTLSNFQPPIIEDNAAPGGDDDGICETGEDCIAQVPSVTYTPGLDFSGSDTFEVECQFDCGASGISDRTSLVIVSVTDVLAAQGNFVIALEGTDPNGDDLTFTLVTPPSHGMVTIDQAPDAFPGNPAGCDGDTCIENPRNDTQATATYVPDDLNAHLEDSFVFEVADGTGRTDTATVIINEGNVAGLGGSDVPEDPINAPEVADISVSVAAGAEVQILLDTEAIALPGDCSLAVTCVAPTQGTLGDLQPLINPAPPSDATPPRTLYTADALASGTDSFVYEICRIDEPTNCTTGTVNITIEDPPTPNFDQTVSTLGETPVTFALQPQFTGFDCYVITTGPTAGTLDDPGPFFPGFNEIQTVEYTANANPASDIADSIVYSHGTGASPTCNVTTTGITVDITVRPLNCETAGNLEVLGDGDGNENGICEPTENCLCGTNGGNGRS